MDQKTLDEAFLIFGMSTAMFIHEMNGAKNFNDAKKKLVSFKDGVRKRRRELAKSLHSDVGGNDDKMALINNALDIIMKIEIQPPPRPQYIRIRTNFGYNAGTTTASSGYTTGTAW